MSTELTLRNPTVGKPNVYTKKVETRTDVFTLIFVQFLIHGKLQIFDNPLYIV